MTNIDFPRMKEPPSESFTYDLTTFNYTTPSAISLVVANTLPMIGVLFWGWSTFAVVVVYWAENVIIGLINVLKMVVSSPLSEEADLSSLSDTAARTRIPTKLEETVDQRNVVARVHHAAKLFLIPFFILHYGMFCFVHGIFVFALFGREFNGVNLLEFWPHAYERLTAEGLLWAVLALAASHLFSFLVNFIYHDEYRRVTAVELMALPYGRVVVLHVAILLGAFALVALGSPIWMLVLLIVGKTILDLKLHVAERRKNTAPQSTTWAAAIEAEMAK